MGRNGLPTIQTRPNGICHDDSSAPVKANTIDELHSLQKKKSAPTTPLNGIDGTAFSFFTEEERQQQQLQSIRYSRKPLQFTRTRKYTNIINSGTIVTKTVTLVHNIEELWNRNRTDKICMFTRNLLQEQSNQAVQTRRIYYQIIKY